MSFDIAPRTLAGPSSISGASQVVASDAGIWKATLGNVIVRSRAEVLAYRAIDVALEGRLNPILIPLCSAYQPKPAGADYGTVPHSDDTPFSDDTEYSGMVIDVVAAADAPARAVSIDVTVNHAGDIEPGQHFSIGERLYRIKRVDYTSATAATIKFWPVLREAVTAGARLEFDNPVCRMRLVDDTQMNLELQLRRFGQPSPSFIEDV